MELIMKLIPLRLHWMSRKGCKACTVDLPCGACHREAYMRSAEAMIGNYTPKRQDLTLEQLREEVLAEQREWNRKRAGTDGRA